MSRTEPYYPRTGEPILLAEQMIAWLKRHEGASIDTMSHTLGRPRYQIREILYGKPDRNADGPAVHNEGKHAR